MDNTTALNSSYGDPAAVNDISINLILLQKIRALQQQSNRFNFNSSTQPISDDYNAGIFGTFSNVQLHTGGQDNLNTNNSLVNVRLSDKRSYGNLYSNNNNHENKNSLLNSSNNVIYYNFNNYLSNANNTNDGDIDDEEELALEEEEEEEEEEEYRQSIRTNKKKTKDEEKKISKRRLSDAQVAKLEASWSEAGGHMGAAGRRLEAQQKVQLAQSLGLHPRQVAIWFQNRRARWKTKHLQHEYNLLKAQYNSMLAETNSLKVEVERLTMELEHKTSSREGTFDYSTSLKLMTLPQHDKVKLHMDKALHHNDKSNEDMGGGDRPQVQTAPKQDLLNNVDGNGSSYSQLSCLAQELCDTTCISSPIHLTMHGESHIRGKMIGHSDLVDLQQHIQSNMQQPTITSSIVYNNLPNNSAYSFQPDQETNLHLPMDWLWELNTYGS